MSAKRESYCILLVSEVGGVPNVKGLKFLELVSLNNDKSENPLVCRAPRKTLVYKHLVIDLLA